MPNNGSCNNHVVYNSYGKGFDEKRRNVEQLYLNLYQFCKYSAAGREDHRATQLDFDVEGNIFSETHRA